MTSIQYDYKGQTFDNYVNTKVIFDHNVYAQAESVLRTFTLIGGVTTNSTSDYAPRVPVKTATNNPSDGILAGQTVVNVFYVDKQGNQLKEPDHKMGYPADVDPAIHTPDAPFTLDVPTEINGMPLYNNHDVDTFLDGKYLKSIVSPTTNRPSDNANDGKVHHMTDPGNVFSYPTGGMGMMYNYYYVYDGSSHARIHKTDSLTGKGLAGAKFVLTSYGQDGDNGKAIQDLIKQYNATTDEATRAKVLTDLQTHALIDATNTSYHYLTDDWGGRVWPAIKSDDSMDLNGDGTIDDTDKDLWIHDNYGSDKHPKYPADTYVGVTDENGNLDIENLEAGKTFYAYELEAPDGYEMPETSEPIQVKTVASGENISSTTVDVENTPKPQENGKLRITKTNAEGTLLQGARFVITTYEGGANALKGLSEQLQALYSKGKTDNDSEVQSIFTQMRHYAVLDTHSTTYGKNTDNYSGVWSSITKNQTDTAYDMNKDGKVDDADKNIWLDSSTGPKVLFGTTDAYGEVNFTDLEKNGDGSNKTYYAIEVNAPKGYVVSQMQSTDNASGEITVVDLPTKVLIDKTSAATGAKLPGAIFELYAAETVNGVKQLKKDTNGDPIKITANANGDTLPVLSTGTEGGTYKQIEINNLPFGEYALIETQAPKGHELIKTPHFFSISGDVTVANVVISDLPQTELPHAGGTMRQITWVIVLVASLMVLATMIYFMRSLQQARRGFQ